MRRFQCLLVVLKGSYICLCNLNDYPFKEIAHSILQWARFLKYIITHRMIS